MSLKVKVLSLLMVFIVAACDNSGSSSNASNSNTTGSDDEVPTGGSGGSSPGGSGSGGSVTFDVNNIRSGEEVIQRLNIVTAEIMRLLKPYLYPSVPDSVVANDNDPLTTDDLDPVDLVLPWSFTAAGVSDGRVAAIPFDVNAFFAAANDGANPLDPFDFDNCLIEEPATSLDGIYGVEFRDIDASDSLSAGDQMVFSFQVLGCDLSTKSNFERAPNQVGGIVRFTFTGTSDVSSFVATTSRRLVGTAEFFEYTYENGLLAFVSGDSETIESGSVDFDITFRRVPAGVADISTAIYTNANVTFTTGTDNLTGPITLTFDRVERNLYAAGDTNPEGVMVAEGDYSLLLDNVVFTSDISGVSMRFDTIGYPNPATDPDYLIGDFDAYPRKGAIVMLGADNTAGVIPAQPEGSNATVAEVDADNDQDISDSELFRATGWDFYIGQFLVPGFEAGTLADDS